jgi:hypothetical protein
MEMQEAASFGKLVNTSNITRKINPQNSCLNIHREIFKFKKWTYDHKCTYKFCKYFCVNKHRQTPNYIKLYAQIYHEIL